MGIDIKINIDFTPRQKRVMRAAVVAGAVIAALGLGVAIAGTPISTTWIVDGGVVSAGSLQGNLNDLQAQITAIQAFQAQATLDGGYSLGATFCGQVGTTAGDMSGLSSTGATGYIKARNACVALCSNSGAHMCTSDELIRTKQVGGATIPFLRVGTLARCRCRPAGRTASPIASLSRARQPEGRSGGRSGMPPSTNRIQRVARTRTPFSAAPEEIQ